MSENMLVDVWGRQKIMSNSPELDLTVWMCEPHSIGAGTELVPLREQNMLLTAERPPPAHIYVYSLHLLTIGVIGIDTVMYLLTIGVIGTDTITSLCSTGEYNCGFMHARQAGYRISYIPSLYLVFLLSFEKNVPVPFLRIFPIVCDFSCFILIKSFRICCLLRMLTVSPAPLLALLPLLLMVCFVTSSSKFLQRPGSSEEAAVPTLRGASVSGFRFAPARTL